ncbi:MAG: trypsin-like peptidase domain-containing protein [Armatimonadetes bacterium]|nr:trypsin-like peptidase domain-containing protein [Armatimonadota bacterium]MDW8122452.1 trypsin-like peptidase domain-containing protein [Armatimonadota bacterium]
MRTHTILIVLAIGVIFGLFAGYYAGRWQRVGTLPDLVRPATARPATRSAGVPRDFISIAKEAESGVCHIATTAPVPEEVRIWRRFFGEPDLERVPYNYGSGFFFSKDGMILTNFHVVQGADTIRVGLTEKQEYPARLVGYDPLLDVAVLKAEGGPPNFRPLPLGDSDRLEKGEWVVAVGKPFGLEKTVTAGIVSAKGRQFEEVGGRMSITSYIQTDAAINPGNSGGPLLNLRGEVIGINTFILGRGGNIGIGFAIPINEVKRVLDRMVKGGRVSRAYLGVEVRDARSPEARQAGVTASSGAFVVGLAVGGPAQQAGVQLADVIVKVNETPIRDDRHLREIILRQTPGATVRLEVIRQGRPISLTVRLGSR